MALHESFSSDETGRPCKCVLNPLHFEKKKRYLIFTRKNISFQATSLHLCLSRHVYLLSRAMCDFTTKAQHLPAWPSSQASS